MSKRKKPKNPCPKPRGIKQKGLPARNQTGRWGSGPPTAFIRRKFQLALDKSKAIEWMQDVAAGKATEMRMTSIGKLIEVPVSAVQRDSTIRFMIEKAWVFGPSTMENSAGTSYSIVINQNNGKPKDEPAKVVNIEPIEQVMDQIGPVKDADAKGI